MRFPPGLSHFLQCLANRQRFLSLPIPVTNSCLVPHELLLRCQPNQASAVARCNEPARLPFCLSESSASVLNIFSILLGIHLGVELLALPPFPSQLGKLCTRYASTAVGCGQLESSTLLWQPTTQPGVAAGRSLANENDDSSPRSSTCQTFTLHRAGQVSC